jgi:hypothetical protein
MAIWKAKVADGVRCYFKVVKNGNLATGIVSGDFNCLLINPADSANQALTVTESTQQGGVYYVDIPSGFLTTHGSGQYGLSLGVHAIGNIDDESLVSLEVVVTSSDDHATLVDVDAARDAVIVYVGQKIP